MVNPHPLFTSKELELPQEQQELDLFGHLSESPLHCENAPQLDMELELCAAMKASIAASPYSREQVADRMNLCFEGTGNKPINIRKLNAWLAPSQGSKNFPAWAMNAFCWAVGSELIYERNLLPLGLKLVDGREEEVIELSRKMIAEKRLQREIRTMKKQWSK